MYEDIIAKIDEFIGDNENTLYTIINATRKTVSTGILLEKRDNTDWGTYYELKWFGITREHKLTAGPLVCPAAIESIWLSDHNTLQIKQHRYKGSQKTDNIIICKTESPTVKLLVK